MFEYLRNIEGNSNPVMMFVKATTTVANQPKAGDAVAVTSGVATKATATSDALLGIAKEPVNVNGEVLVIVDPQATFRVPITGGSLSQASLFGTFDLSDEKTVNLGGTSKNVVQVVGIDANGDTAVVKLAARVIK